MANPNPNEPNYPYSGGTDNPGDNTAIASSYNASAASETGLLSPRQEGVIYPPFAAPISQSGTDSPLAPNAVIPEVASGFESGTDRGADTGGVYVDPATGLVREAGQDETAGESETTSDTTPSAFPEPNP
jgi:hypothetical protein